MNARFIRGAARCDAGLPRRECRVIFPTTLTASVQSGTALCLFLNAQLRAGQGRCCLSVFEEERQNVRI